MLSFDIYTTLGYDYLLYTVKIYFIIHLSPHFNLIRSTIPSSTLKQPFLSIIEIVDFKYLSS